MIFRLRLAFVFLGWCIFCLFLRADDSDATINADLQRIIAAAKANDVSVAVDLIYSPVVAANGGRDEMKKLAEQAKEEMLAKGFKIISYTTSKPYQRVTTSVNDYVIIPAHQVIEIDTHRVDTMSYELAIRARGSAKWEYLDGAAITSEMKDHYFPDLKNKDFPEIKTKFHN